MKIIVWNSQDKCVADYHKLIRGCDVLCLLDCGQWTVPMYALQIQNGLFHWKDEHADYFIPARVLVGLGAICFTLFSIVSILESGTSSK